MYIMSGMGAITEQEQRKDCQLNCYDTKSKAYDACRDVPVVEREKKVACFEKADAQLKDCLGKCSSPSGATIAILAGIGLLVLKAAT